VNCKNLKTWKEKEKGIKRNGKINGKENKKRGKEK
jgi:hypothetical protein